jgi:hypothetical protein
LRKQFAKVRGEFFNSGNQGIRLNAPLIAQKIADRLHSEKQQRLF